MLTIRAKLAAVSLLLTLGCGEPRNNEQPLLPNSLLGSAELQRRLLAIAEAKAVELGYDVKNMDSAIVKQEDIIAVYFLRKRRPGVAVFGGGLAVYLDESGNVLQITKTY